MAGKPIVPRDNLDPTGTARSIRAADREFSRKIRQCVDIYKGVLDQIPAEPVVNARYVFRLIDGLLTSLLESAGALIDAVLLEGGAARPWFSAKYVETAMNRGAAAAFRNLARQSPEYQRGRRTFEELAQSEPYRRRVALVRAREYEEMRGLAGQVKTDMSRVLSDGMARGQNPRTIAKTLSEQTGIEQSRARRIARTEIPMAYRRARWDEAEDSEQTYGLKFRLMHLSALSPSTRKTHADRHGKLYTQDQVRDWYSVDGNSINCKCTQLEILVDDDGKPVVASILNQAREQYDRARAQSDDPWTGK